jgi:hypothetical protein
MNRTVIRYEPVEQTILPLYLYDADFCFALLVQQTHFEQQDISHRTLVLH